MSLKNILLLMTDQHRLDYTGYAGFGSINTPNIDRIAGSVGFTNCQTVNPICTPARTALITGRYSRQIGTLEMSGDLSLQIPTFMQALQKRGYFTAGIGKFHFLQTWPWNRKRGAGIPLTEIRESLMEYGYDYVWETSGKQLALKNYCDYCEHMDGKGLLDQFRDFVESAGRNSDEPCANSDPAHPWPFNEEDYIDIVTADRIIDTIKKRPGGKPFYVFGSFCSPHKPYDPPPSWLDQIPYEEVDDFALYEGQNLTESEKKRLYCQRRASRAMIKLVDDQIGRIFDLLEEENLLDDTVVIFTSDHGDMLGDHRRLQKAVYWKQSCAVPAAILHPDYPSCQINASPVENIDISATILDIAGLDPVEALSKDWPAFNDIIPCRSLMPIVRGERDSIRDFTYTECSGKWEMLKTDRFKYMAHLDYENPDRPDEKLYNLVSDPDELVNIAGDLSYSDNLDWFRKRRIFIKDKTPPAQTSWAPLMCET